MFNQKLVLCVFLATLLIVKGDDEFLQLSNDSTSNDTPQEYNATMGHTYALAGTTNATTNVTTWGNGTYVSNEPALGDNCANSNGFQLVFEMDFKQENYTLVNGTMELCLHVKNASNESLASVAGRKVYVSDVLDSSYTWPTEAGQPTTPSFNHNDLFSADNFFNTSWTDKGNGGNDTELTQWCLSSENFRSLFEADFTTNKTTNTLYVTLALADLRNGTCASNATEAVLVEFCGVGAAEGDACHGKHPTFSLASSDSGSSNWLLWGGIAAAALIVIVVIVVCASKNGGNDGKQDEDYQVQE